MSYAAFSYASSTPGRTPSAGAGNIGGAVNIDPSATQPSDCDASKQSHFALPGIGCWRPFCLKPAKLDSVPGDLDVPPDANLGLVSPFLSTEADNAAVEEEEVGIDSIEHKNPVAVQFGPDVGR